MKTGAEQGPHDDRDPSNYIVIESPLTYANDLLRHSMGLNAYYPWCLDLLVLALYSVAFFFIAAWIFNVYRRRSRARSR